MGNRRPREELERRIVVDLPVGHDAAVAVARVLAETHVADEHELRRSLSDRPQRTLDDPLVVPGTRALVVLLLRNAEQDHRTDAVGLRGRGGLAGAIDRPPRDPGQALER